MLKEYEFSRKVKAVQFTGPDSIRDIIELTAPARFLGESFEELSDEEIADYECSTIIIQVLGSTLEVSQGDWIVRWDYPLVSGNGCQDFAVVPDDLFMREYRPTTMETLEPPF